MRSQKNFQYFALAAVIVAIGYLGAPRAIGGALPGPFVATSSEVSLRDDGQPFLAETILHGVRSDGSTVRVRPIAKRDNTGIAIQRSIDDLERGKRIFVDGLTGSITIRDLSPDDIRFVNNGPNCAAQPSAETDTILGFEVVKSTMQHKMAGGKLLRIELWRAPALRCFTLRSRAYTGSSEADLKLQSAKEVTSLKIQEPSADLFAIPADYKERAQSGE